MGGPASSYATAGIALRVTESHKPPPHHYKVETPSGQRSLRGPYWNFVYCTGDHDKWRYTISTCRSRLVIQPPKIYISSDTVTVLLFHSAPNPQNPLSYELTFFPTQPLNLYSIFARRTSGVETFKMFCVQDMKVYRGRRGIDPPTLKFSTTWRCMVNFRTPPLQGHKPCTHWIGGSMDPTAGLDTSTEQKNITILLGFEAQIIEPMTC